MNSFLHVFFDHGLEVVEQGVGPQAQHPGQTVQAVGSQAAIPKDLRHVRSILLFCLSAT
ncbi:MAG: hypothetical protein KAS38_21785 [Anaerolineales bacterium]|nr:hypothetical protein [Anaerolineales bacterium]